MARTALVQRKTAETQVEVQIDLEGTGRAEVDTGVGFFDHMLALLAKHSAIDLRVLARGDLDVDAHHTVEDVGICLGQAVRQALGEKACIARYGHVTLPMEDALASAAVDLGGRAYFVYRVVMPSPKIGDFDSDLVAEFWQAFAAHALCNLHLRLHDGRNNHHVAEALFKAAARALRSAWQIDPRAEGIPSTKGTL